MEWYYILLIVLASLLVLFLITVYVFIKPGNPKKCINHDWMYKNPIAHRGYYNNKNRLYIYENLIRLGFECIEPKGAFYLFIKAPNGDDIDMANKAKKYGILIVPGSSFGCKGYCRLAYCVSFEKIEKSISEFEKLAREVL